MDKLDEQGQNFLEKLKEPTLVEVKKITVTITQEHIDKARLYFNDSMKRPTHCPIALALQGVGFPKASVGCMNICLDVRPDGQHLHVDPPRLALLFISAFDSGNPVQPVTFDLTIED